MIGSIHGCVERTDGVPVGMGVRYREIGVTDVGQRTGSIRRKKMDKFQLGKVYIVSGVRKKARGRKPTCPICGLKIFDNHKGTMIHHVSEMPQHFHTGCAYELAAHLSEITQKNL